MLSQDTFLRDRSRFSLLIALALMLAAAAAFAGQLQQARHTASLHDPEILIEADVPPPSLKLVCGDQKV